MSTEYRYQVALSFAGEDRQYAEGLAQLLEKKNITVFYDFYEKANLWGKDLYKHLNEIYKSQAKFCVIFLSQNYAKKLWTRHELSAAQARAFKENEDYILPLRVDSTVIPDLVNATVGYLTLEQTSLEEVASILEEKLRGKSTVETQKHPPILTTQERVELPQPEEMRSGASQSCGSRGIPPK